MSINDEKNNDNSRTYADSEKQEKVGSLSFKVIDESSKKPSSEQSKSIVGGSKDTQIGAKRPTCRAKVPFEIGYTHMDWLKVTRTHPDLAGAHIFFLLSYIYYVIIYLTYKIKIFIFT